MRAVVFDRELQFDPQYPDPSPEAEEALVQVHLAGICSTDLEIVGGYMDYRGVLGHEMVGTVTQGPRPWRDKRVVCEINNVCRKCDMCQRGLATHCRNRTVMGIERHPGCFADLVRVPVRNLHEVPDSIADEEAVFVEPLAAAYQVMRQVPIEPRSTVAVIGSGRLGLLVAQVLATTGCQLEVVGRNALTLELCEKRGITARHVNDLPSRADRKVVVECSGSPQGLELALEIVRPRGTVVLKSTYAGTPELRLAPAVIKEVTVLGSRCGPFRDAINVLARKQIDVRSMITASLPIEQAVAAFEAAADRKHVKVLLKINPRSGR